MDEDYPNDLEPESVPDVRAGREEVPPTEETDGVLPQVTAEELVEAQGTVSENTQAEIPVAASQ
jgi:hypothetical protein